MPAKSSACRMVLMLSTGLSGCTLMGPNWYQPGPAGYQQAQAREYDPYPDPAAGPEVEGGRPREFDEPREPIHPERRATRW